MLYQAAPLPPHTYAIGANITDPTASPINFASLAFDDVLHKFTLSINDSLSQFGSMAFVSALAVDYTDVDDRIRVRRVTGDVRHVRFSDRDGVPTSDFDFLFKIGSGRDRLTSGESVSWISRNFDINDLGTSASPFALRVQGITSPGSMLLAKDSLEMDVATAYLRGLPFPWCPSLKVMP